jgi:cell division septation protein DedD
MSDQNFHEIQLSGKQLVFLFISAVGVAVVIFLLGVSVGRGVRGVALAGGIDTAAPSDTVVSTTPPPATQPAPGELSYHNTLQGSGRAGAPGTPPPAPPSEPVTPPPQSTPPPATQQPATQTPPPQATAQGSSGAAKAPDKATQSPQKPATPPEKVEKPDPKAPSASARGNWVVQVMALKSREGADKLVSDLKNKGYPAFVVNPASGLYRVRVGPFAKRTEAEQIAGRLAKEGYQSPAVQAR